MVSYRMFAGRTQARGQSRAPGPPAPVTFVIPHFQKLDYSHFNALSRVVRQLLGIYESV